MIEAVPAKASGGRNEGGVIPCDPLAARCANIGLMRRWSVSLVQCAPEGSTPRPSVSSCGRPTA